MAEHPEGFSLARALLRVGIQHFVESYVPGAGVFGSLFEEVAMRFCEGAWNWLASKPVAEQRSALEALARLTPEEARAIADEELAKREGLPADRVRELLHFASTVPLTAGKAMQIQPNGASRLQSLPRSASELLRFLPLRAPRFQAGHRPAGRDYVLEALLGMGSFGEVWRARHTHGGLLPPRAFKFCLDPELKASLHKELELLGRVQADGSHPGIVQLLETSLDSDPPFLVYEYVDGGDLLAWLESRPAPLSIEEIRGILLQATEALAFAHSKGIAHLDLKPANLLLTREGQIKITDFGIGRLVARSSFHQANTKPLTGPSSTLLRGAHTPLYADRAQRLGQAVGPEADVYAMGVMAYQMLMGDVTLELSAYWSDELEERQAPPDLRAWIAGCVAAPQKRFQNATALREALQKPTEVQEAKSPGGGAGAKPPPPPNSDPAPPRGSAPNPAKGLTPSGLPGTGGSAPSISEKVIPILKRHLGKKGFFWVDELDPALVSNIRRKHHLAEGEKLYAFITTTVLGRLGNGISFTSRRIAWDGGAGMFAGHLAYEEFPRSTFGKESLGFLSINGKPRIMTASLHLFKADDILGVLNDIKKAASA